MKAIGVIRKVDQFGKISLPREIRGSFEINIGDSVEIYLDGNFLYVKNTFLNVSFVKASKM